MGAGRLRQMKQNKEFRTFLTTRGCLGNPQTIPGLSSKGKFIYIKILYSSCPEPGE